MSDARHMRIIVIAVDIAAHSHDKQSHLLVAVQEVAVDTVAVSILADGAGIDRAHRVLEHLIAFFQTALTRAEDALVFSREGIADPILQQRT